MFDAGLQELLKPHMAEMKPRPSIYTPDFIAANQSNRADNVLKGTKAEMMKQIQQDIQDFKAKKKLDKVIVVGLFLAYALPTLHLMVAQKLVKQDNLATCVTTSVSLCSLCAIAGGDTTLGLAFKEALG